MQKIGNSIDIHRLEKGAPLYIGGVLIPSDIGSVSFSDGDALLHCICESLIGAMGLGDLGEHFSDKNEKYHNIRSTYFVEEVKKMLKENGYKIVNIDVMIVIEKPKLSTFKNVIKESISNLFEIDINQINIKAGTNEKIGSIGNSESYLCWATCLIEK